MTTMELVSIRYLVQIVVMDIQKEGILSSSPRRRKVGNVLWSQGHLCYAKTRFVKFWRLLRHHAEDTGEQLHHVKGKRG